MSAFHFRFEASFPRSCFNRCQSVIFSSLFPAACTFQGVFIWSSVVSMLANSRQAHSLSGLGSHSQIGKATPRLAPSEWNPLHSGVLWERGVTYSCDQGESFYCSISSSLSLTQCPHTHTHTVIQANTSQLLEPAGTLLDCLRPAA